MVTADVLVLTCCATGLTVKKWLLRSFIRLLWFRISYSYVVYLQNFAALRMFTRLVKITNQKVSTEPFLDGTIAWVWDPWYFLPLSKLDMIFSSFHWLLIISTFRWSDYIIQNGLQDREISRDILQYQPLSILFACMITPRHGNAFCITALYQWSPPVACGFPT